MVNTTTCDGCIHADVCCKKKVYEMFIEQVGKVAVYPSQQSTWYATDCNDVLLELKCKHMRKENQFGLK